MNRSPATSSRRISGARLLNAEPLEPRTLLATFTVTNLADGPVTMSGELPGSLRQAIFDANAEPGADEVVFQAGLTGVIPVTAGEMAITGPLSVIGPGRTDMVINAGGSSRVFRIDDAAAGAVDVEIAGLTLDGGFSKEAGGAILSSERLTIRDSLITGSTALDGGGVYSYGEAAELHVVDSTISGNSAEGLGGGIYAYILGTPSTISGSTIANNTAYLGGGVSGYTGLDGVFTISGTTISSNTAELFGGGAEIFAVDGGNVTIEQSTISGNDSSFGGGIAATADYGGVFSISHSMVTGNQNSGEYGLIGGGIALLNYASSATVEMSTITGNTGGLAGGGGIATFTEALGQTTIRDSTISGNTSEGPGAGIAVYGYEGGVTVVRDSTITQNDTTYSGGGVSVYHASVIKPKKVVIAAVADLRTRRDSRENDRGQAAGVAGPSSTLIERSLISGNSAGGTGGGVDGYNTDGGDITIRQSVVSGNSAGGAGGGVYLGVTSTGTASIVDSTLSGNDAAGAGGGAYVATIESDVTLLGSTLSGNDADLHGGGLAVYGTATVRHTTVTGNTADADSSLAEGGGGIAVLYGSVALDHAIVAANVDNSAVAPDLGLFDAKSAAVNALFTLLGDNTGSPLGEAAIGNPDAAGNLVGDPNGAGTIDPGLEPLGDNGGVSLPGGGTLPTHALRPDSPATQAGDPSAVAGSGTVPLFDQRGEPFARIAQGRIDLGAVEKQEPAFAADFDGDGDVDGADFLVWQNSFLLPSGATQSDGDADGDGDVDGQDFLVWQAQFPSPGGGQGSPAAHDVRANRATVPRDRLEETRPVVVSGRLRAESPDIWAEFGRPRGRT